MTGRLPAMDAEGWHSLYIPTGAGGAEQVARALRDALAACGYQLYDPFPGGSGPSFGWTAAGPDESAAALDAWRRAGCPPEDLARALAGSALPAAEARTPTVPLPPDVQALARSVDAGQAQKLTARLTQTLFGKLGGLDPATRAGAMSLLGGPGWEGAAGRRLQAVMACLRVPEAWRLPEEGDLRAAYPVARARQHRPDGSPLPGDAEALARVPDALAYLPVYAGRR